MLKRVRRRGNGGPSLRAKRQRTCREADDPIGVAPWITAGERSHPRTGTRTLLRPQGGANLTPTVGRGRNARLHAAASPLRPRDGRQPRRAAGVPVAYPREPKLNPHGVLFLLPFLSAGGFAHPRLSIVRPPWGRQPRSTAPLRRVHTAARGDACVETRFIASHPLGAQPRPNIPSP